MECFVFVCLAENVQVLEIDHDAGVVYCETIQEITNRPSIDLLLPVADQVGIILYYCNYIIIS